MDLSRYMLDVLIAIYSNGKSQNEVNEYSHYLATLSYDELGDLYDSIVK